MDLHSPESSFGPAADDQDHPVLEVERCVTDTLLVQLNDKLCIFLLLWVEQTPDPEKVHWLLEV